MLGGWKLKGKAWCWQVRSHLLMSGEEEKEDEKAQSPGGKRAGFFPPINKIMQREKKHPPPSLGQQKLKYKSISQISLWVGFLTIIYGDGPLLKRLPHNPMV